MTHGVPVNLLDAGFATQGLDDVDRAAFLIVIQEQGGRKPFDFDRMVWPE